MSQGESRNKENGQRWQRSKKGKLWIVVVNNV
jgi:hypothetical protein